MTPTVTETGSFRTYRYPSTDERNPLFDGPAFFMSWMRFAGSAHRHWQTKELVLCWSTKGKHPATREMLREQLESHPGNVGTVLAAIDSRNEAFNRAALASSLPPAERHMAGEA